MENLISTEVLESPRGQLFLYDGIKSDEDSQSSDVAQLVVPLNDENAENLSTEEYFTAQKSAYHNVRYVYPDIEIPFPWDGWQWDLLITLKTDNRENYMLCISLVCYGANNVSTRGQVMLQGSIAEIAQTVKADIFPNKASSIFDTCLEALTPVIEKSERRKREAQLFANTDITDYDSVIEFVDFLKYKNVLQSKGHGMDLFKYDNVISLIDRTSKRVNVLVGRDGKANFCRIEDFPAELLEMIRREKRNWNLEVYNLSVGHFNDDGQAFVTWIISPYYYCPMDEDGFGEEEELEVAVTCHINADGHLVDTPVWKPYTGPLR